MRNKSYTSLMFVLALSGVSAARAEDTPAETPAPTSAAMAMPTMAGSLSANANPASINAGPIGNVYVTGAISGIAFAQSSTFPGDNDARIDLSNGQIIAQTTEGLVQFYVQAGGYSFPSLGTAYTPVDKTVSNTFGVVPVAFVKLVPSDSFSIYAGKLPTLIGGEYAFSYENMNIERGLLWNQENIVNRGVQVNYTVGALTLNAALSDGYYSDRLNWITGAATYVIDPANSVYVQAGGAMSQNSYSSTATSSVYNNSQMYVAGYTYTNAPFTISPYVQYTVVPKYAEIGVLHEGETFGAALLASYAFTDPALEGVSLPVRVEYITSSGSSTDGSPNLLYGPGSTAFSVTVTPTYQAGAFFGRFELSYVGASGTAAGSAFGSSGTDKSQFRGLLEAGFIF